MRNQMWAVAAFAAAALTVAGCSSGSSNSPASSASTPSSSSGSQAASSSATVTTATIAGAKVLTNAKGFTLYSFGPDTSTASNCNGACATYWPPVKGPVTAMAGLTGTFGTIKRSDGTLQATYDGHPLYTYVGDKSPGQAKGNGLNLSGGVWHEVTASGSAAPATSPSSSSSGGGYGY
jgi:predicted lipoprotein with Yx(FWY)xxD motif